MKRMIRTTAIVGGLTLALALGACSESNPLMSKSNNEAANLLYEASEKAGVQMGKQEMGSGSFYRHCMMGEKPKAFCNELYKKMSAALEMQEIKMSAAQINSKKLFEKTKAELKHIGFLMG